MSTEPERVPRGSTRLPGFKELVWADFDEMYDAEFLKIVDHIVGTKPIAINKEVLNER